MKNYRPVSLMNTHGKNPKQNITQNPEKKSPIYISTYYRIMRVFVENPKESINF